MTLFLFYQRGMGRGFNISLKKKITNNKEHNLAMATPIIFKCCMYGISTEVNVNQVPTNVPNHMVS